MKPAVLNTFSVAVCSTSSTRDSRSLSLGSPSSPRIKGSDLGLSENQAVHVSRHCEKGKGEGRRKEDLFKQYS